MIYANVEVITRLVQKYVKRATIWNLSTRKIKNPKNK
jgi:hypothetical protein